MIENIVYFLIAAGVLIVCGIYLVKSLTKISKFLGISEFSAAFIIMAFATSIPELFVGISSALAGNPSLSLGNIIGANILNLTLVTGIIVLLSKEVKFESGKVGKEVYFMLLILIVMIGLFVIGKELSRIDGVILLGLFSIHVYGIFKKRKKYTAKIKNGRMKLSGFYWLIIFLLTLIGLFISSSFAVRYASLLAIDLNLPKIIVGLFLLSIATTLPELVFGISASKMKHKEMAIGDQIGSVVVNTAFILGIVALIHPISAEFVPFLVSAVFMFIAAFIFVTFVKSGGKLEKYEGISLILIYVLFVIVEFFAK